MSARPPLGLVKGMPAEEYHQIAAMSAGGLKRMAKSPAHFYGLQMDPARPPAEQTPAMRNGTLVHTALFEPDELAKRYVVKPDGIDYRTKDGRAWRDSQTAEVIEPEQLASAIRQAAAVRALPDVAALLADGYGEASAFWIDEQTGVLCKCRPDWTAPTGDGVIIVDGKTCQDASPRGFQRTVVNFEYALGAAWYIDGYERATGLQVLGYVFACVESSWPHAAAAYMLNDEWIDASRTRYRSLLMLYAECLRSGVWPGYQSSIQPMEMPPWIR